MHIRHVGIVTQDIKKAQKFWQMKGFTPVYDKVEKVHIVKLERDSSTIELLQYESMSDHNLRKQGISHIAFTTDPEDNFIELVEENNAVGQ